MQSCFEAGDFRKPRPKDRDESRSMAQDGRFDATTCMGTIKTNRRVVVDVVNSPLAWQELLFVPLIESVRLSAQL